MSYKQRQNAILDQVGNQIAVVLPTNCTKKKAIWIARHVVELLNVKEKAAKIRESLRVASNGEQAR